MRVVYFYALEEKHLLSGNQLDDLKERAGATLAISMLAENQIEHLQYPYIDIVEFDLEERAKNTKRPNTCFEPDSDSIIDEAVNQIFKHL